MVDHGGQSDRPILAASSAAAVSRERREFSVGAQEDARPFRSLRLFAKVGRSSCPSVSPPCNAERMMDMADSSLLDEAIAFAAKCHAGQVRKGSKTPYILHPLEAASICATFTDDVEVLSAAVLHDVVEDTEATVEDVEKRFGDRVAMLVAGESENKREGMPAAETWKIRKEETIEHLKAAEDPGVRMVCLGDKLSNIRAIQRDYDRLGDEVWQRFNQKDPKEHAWYYKALAEAMKDDLGHTAAWIEYNQRVHSVFDLGHRGRGSGLITLGYLLDFCDNLRRLGVHPDTVIQIDREKGVEGYTYADDLHFDSCGASDDALILIGSYSSERE